MKVTTKAQLFLMSGLSKTDKNYIFISVNSGGCSGFQYSIDLIADLPEDAINLNGIIYTDSISKEYLEDITLDLENQLGYKKLIIINPLATSSCSCGKSFSV